MKRLETAEVVGLLIEYGRRAQLAGGNPYRARAYIRAAESLAAQTEPLDRLVANKRLREIPGIGEAIAAVIEQLHRTGSHPSLEKMRGEIPFGVLDLLAIPGLRPDRAVTLYRELGVTSLAELEGALADDSLWKTRSLSSTLQRKIKQGLQIWRDPEGTRHMHRAEELLLAAQENVRRGQKELKSVTIAGDFRRGAELIGDLALVAEAPSIEGSPAALKSGDLTLHLTDPKRLGITLLRATGNADHVAQLEEIARGKGYALTADGLMKGRKIIAAKTEADIYKALGLAYIEPELREGRGEIERAAAGKLPGSLRRRTCAASYMRIQLPPTGRTRSNRWQMRRVSAATGISA